jgi:hypothetical protein
VAPRVGGATGPSLFGYTAAVDLLRPRRTHLGHVPSAWLRPRRREVLLRLLVVAIYGLSLATMGRSLEPLDMRVFYLARDVVGILEAMGEAGRAEYRLFAIADLGFIVAYSAMFVSWTKFLRVRDGLPRAFHPALALLPAIPDLVETAGALVLVGQFPEPSAAWTIAVAIATPVKWLTVLGMIAALLWGERMRWYHRDDPR